MEELTGPGPGGEEGVVAELLRVAVAGAVLGLAAHLTDGGVEVDDQPVRSRPGTERPRPTQCLGQDRIELAHMAERERPEERAQGGWGHHPVGQHRLGGTGPQHVGMIDVAPTGSDGVDQGQDLASGKGSAHSSRQVDHLVDQAFETEPDHQCRHQQEPGVGHQIRLIEGHLDAVDSARY